MSSPPLTILVHPGSLGDVLILLSVIQELPGEIWLVTRSPAYELEGSAPRVARWVDLDGPLGPVWLGDREPTSAEWESAAAPRRGARLVVFRADPTTRIAANLSRLGAGEVRVASARPPLGRSAHQHVADLLGVGVRRAGAAWLAPKAPPKVHAHRASSVIVHPGSGGRSKRWPVEAFAEVATKLAAAGLEVAWSLGPAETEDGVEPPAVGSTLPFMEVPALASCLSNARAYLGCDSGVSHLAAAVGAPSVLLFGPSDAATWAPSAPWVEVMAGDPAAPGGRWGLSTDDVADRVVRAASRRSDPSAADGG